MRQQIQMRCVARRKRREGEFGKTRLALEQPGLLNFCQGVAAVRQGALLQRQVNLADAAVIPRGINQEYY